MKNNKIALILDKIDRGTIQTSLQTNKYKRVLKLLNSSVDNWESICEILEKDTEKEIIILAKLTEYTLFKMSTPNFAAVVDRLKKLIKERKHIIFIYKDNLFGDFSFLIPSKSYNRILGDENEVSYKEINQWLEFNGVAETETQIIIKIKKLIQTLNEDLNVLPYEKLLDIEIAGQSFIENNTEGLLFRLYIPTQRIWSNEFGKFITLFRDYASIVAKQELKISQDKTDTGIICSLFAIDNNITEVEINTLYKEFTSFMDLCSLNPKDAEDLLNNKLLSEPVKNSIMKKYIKEAQRLSLDIKQEREIKLINIKHKLESELQELEISKELAEYIDNSIPSHLTTRNLITGAQNIQTQIININPQIIQKAEGIICNELNGNILYSNEEKELLKLIDKFSNDFAEASKLNSALLELKDKATSSDIKRTSWQKLYGFLGKVGEKIGDVGVSLLTKYLEQQMGMQ